VRGLARYTGGARTALVAGFILAVTFAAHFPSLRNGFTNYDDPYYVLDNPVIRSLSWSSVRHIFSSHILMYHPLSMLSLAVDYRLFGLDPAGYHAVNLALHLANTLLVFWVLRLLCGGVTAAAVGALLFGVHPLHVESVAWVSERKDVLSACFFLGALGAYLRHIGGTRRRAWYLLSLGLLAASLLSKPMGVTFPLVMFLCDYLRGRAVDRRSCVEKIPFFALALIFSLIALFPADFFEHVETTWKFTADVIFVAPYSLIFYLAKAVVPLGLSAVYPYPAKTAGLLPWRFLLAPLPAALVCLAVARNARGSRVVPFGFLFIVVTLLPVLAKQIGPHFAADRYFYLPSLGLCYLAGVGFSRLLGRPATTAPTRAAALAALVLVTAAFSVLTWRRTHVWFDNSTLWDSVIAAYPEPSFAYLNRGLGRFEAGDAEGSIADLNVYLTLDRFNAQAYKVRGNANLNAGRVQAALDDFGRAITLKPDYAEALNNRGALLADRGELERAVDDFTRAVTANPRYRIAFVNRAKARAAQGDQHGADQDLAKADALEPRTP
jgi:protein O-mannosyl-transferase